MERAEDRNIVLIGMPGVGKSTTGVIVAKKMEYCFMDTDICIQTGEGRSLQDIIRTEGVAGFRAVEEYYVCQVNCRSHVVATGGSVVYSPKAMAHLKKDGIIVFLSLSLEQLERRLSDIDARGVIRAPGQTIAGLYEERMPLYRQYADVTILCDDLSPDRVMKEILGSVIP